MTPNIIVDLTSLSHNFPRITEPEIKRDNFLATLDYIFEESDLIIAEGPEQMGKTWFLAQFAKRYPKNAFSVFVRPAGRMACDPILVASDLIEQIAWHLDGRRPKVDVSKNADYLKQLIDRLARRAWRERETYYFVIDGLEDFDLEERNVVEGILDLLPLGIEKFKFLFVAKETVIPDRTRRNLKAKPFVLSAFTLSDTVQYFSDLNLTLDEVEELWKGSKGSPGLLASIRRSLLSGESKQTLIAELHKRIPAPFELEWGRLPVGDSSILQLIGVLAHSRRPLTESDVARVVNLNVETVTEIISPFSFLECVGLERELRFASEAFKRFAAEKLISLRRDVDNLLTEDLLDSQSSDDALLYLPGYLEETKRYEDLFNFLTPQTFSLMVAKSQSLSPIMARSEAALHVAIELKRDPVLIRLSAHRSAVVQRQSTGIYRSEIEAHLALSNFDAAQALAQTATLKEERLQLLGLVARKRPELIDQIKALYAQLEPEKLKDKALEIAADLIGIVPELAIDLVERATNTTDDDNAIDIAYAKFSLAAAQPLSKDSEAKDLVQQLRDKIKNPRFQGFATAASLLVGDHSSAQVIAEVKRLDGAGMQLFLLRQWAVENQKRADASEVVEYGIKLAIQTTAYAPNARVLLDLASPIPFIDDEATALRLVGLCDSQRASVEENGPTEDFTKLQLLLARAESKFDRLAARNRLEESYLAISYITELDLKVNCLAYFHATVVEIDPNQEFETTDSFKSLSETDLRDSINLLLESTATHCSATRSVLEALTPFRPDIVLQIASELNIEPRRDQAYLEIVQAAASADSKSNFYSTTARSALNSIQSPEKRSSATLGIIFCLAFKNETERHKYHEEAHEFFARIVEIRDEEQRCQAYCAALQYLRTETTSDDQALYIQLQDDLKKSWNEINSGWTKVDVAFQIAATLADVDIEVARQYLNNAEQIRRELAFDAVSGFSAFAACIMLAIRSYAGLLKNRRDSEDDLRRLLDLISQIPAVLERAQLWTELSLRAYASGRRDLLDRLVSEHIRPLLVFDTSNRPFASWQHELVIAICAPAIFTYNRRVAEETFSKLGPEYSEEAYSHTAEFLLRKIPLSDPFDRMPGSGYVLTNDEIGDILNVIENLQSDSNIYHFIVAIADTVTSNYGRNKFTIQQKLEIARRVSEIAKTKLPRPRFIKHSGFKIAAEAQAARIRSDESSLWNRLLNDARSLPNLSDKAYVITIIAGAIPGKLSVLRKQALTEAKEAIVKIPSPSDRVDRLESLTHTAWRSDQDFAKSCLRSGMEFAVQSDTPYMFSLQRRLVDLAHRFDPDLAASLASIVDGDPARIEAKNNVKRRLKTLELGKSLERNDRSNDEVQKGEDREYATVAWTWLGRMNAGRAEALRFDHLREALKAASSLPMTDAYPIFSLAIETGIRRWGNSPSGQANNRPIFETMVDGALLAKALAARSVDRIEIAVKTAMGDPTQSVIIKEGDREQAISVLRDWVQSSVADYILICDPYFGPGDLEILIMVKSLKPDCHVKILTSSKHHEKIKKPLPEEYEQAWLEISDQDPPITDIVVVGTKSGKFPVHDRWWLTQDAGIRLGTSYNGVGNRISEISRLSRDEAKEREYEVQQIMNRSMREHNGERLLFNSFSL